MTRLPGILLCTLVTISPLVVGLFLSPSVQAQSEADAAYNAYNSAFMVQANGQTFYASTLASLGTAPEQGWGGATDIEVAEDAYQYDHSQTNRNPVISLLKQSCLLQWP